MRRLLLSGVRRARRLADIVLIERPRGVPREAAHTVWLEDVGLSHAERRSYAPSPWGLLRRLVPVEDVDSEDVFADLGCGMGRVVLEAAEHYPFKRVLGVEIVPGLAAEAEALLRRNAQRLRSASWTIVNADLADYAIPDDVTVAYLYDPFVGELFESVIRRLRASVERHPRRLRIVYVTPTERARLEHVDGLAVTRHGTTGFIHAGARYRYLVAESRPGAS